MSASGPRLLSDEALESSFVIANRDMNRERGLRGSNGYAREVGFEILDFLVGRLARRPGARWLDLCCGSGLALLEAGRELAERGLGERVSLVGVDLVGAFAGGERPACVQLVEASLRTYTPWARCDLVTCVHGLHYLGDKLGALARACGWLEEDGVLVATLDLGTLALGGGHAARQVPRALRAQGLAVDTRRHRVRCDGARNLSLPWKYLGADDRDTKSYTGQPAVMSHYA